MTNVTDFHKSVIKIWKTLEKSDTVPSADQYCLKHHYNTIKDNEINVFLKKDQGSKKFSEGSWSSEI